MEFLTPRCRIWISSDQVPVLDIALQLEWRMVSLQFLARPVIYSKIKLIFTIRQNSRKLCINNGIFNSSLQNLNTKNSSISP